MSLGESLKAIRYCRNLNSSPFSSRIKVILVDSLLLFSLFCPWCQKVKKWCNQVLIFYLSMINHTFQKFIPWSKLHGIAFESAIAWHRHADIRNNYSNMRCGAGMKMIWKVHYAFCDVAKYAFSVLDVCASFFLQWSNFVVYLCCLF